MLSKSSQASTAVQKRGRNADSTSSPAKKVRLSKTAIQDEETASDTGLDDTGNAPVSPLSPDVSNFKYTISVLIDYAEYL